MANDRLARSDDICADVNVNVSMQSFLGDITGDFFFYRPCKQRPEPRIQRSFIFFCLECCRWGEYKKKKNGDENEMNAKQNNNNKKKLREGFAKKKLKKRKKVPFFCVAVVDDGINPPSFQWSKTTGSACSGWSTIPNHTYFFTPQATCKRNEPKIQSSSL